MLQEACEMSASFRVGGHRRVSQNNPYSRSRVGWHFPIITRRATAAAGYLARSPRPTRCPTPPQARCVASESFIGCVGESARSKGSASRSATSQKQPVTPTLEPPCDTTKHANPSTVTPPTSSQRSSPEHHAAHDPLHARHRGSTRRARPSLHRRNRSTRTCPPGPRRHRHGEGGTDSPAGHFAAVSSWNCVGTGDLVLLR